MGEIQHNNSFMVYKQGLGGFVRDNIQAVAKFDVTKMSASQGSPILTSEQIPTWTEYYSETKKIAASLLAKNEASLNMEPLEINPVLNEKVSLCRTSITNLKIDAIVNAANNSLLGGGGVDGAIHKAAGQELYNECESLHGCATGEAVITKGYNLPAKHVIHTVGPRGEKPDLLQSCYTKCLNLALENNLRTIAFPCVSTGIYGYPQKAAAKVALATARRFLETNPESMDRIIFCVFLDSDLAIYQTLLPQFFPLPNESESPEPDSS